MAATEDEAEITISKRMQKLNWWGHSLEIELLDTDQMVERLPL